MRCGETGGIITDMAEKSSDPRGSRNLYRVFPG